MLTRATESRTRMLVALPPNFPLAIIIIIIIAFGPRPVQDDCFELSTAEETCICVCLTIPRTNRFSPTQAQQSSGVSRLFRFIAALLRPITGRYYEPSAGAPTHVRASAATYKI